MGHLRLGRLPRTRRWQQVVGLLNQADSSFEEIAQKSIYAIEIGLKNASQDDGLITVFWLLTKLPEAASKGDFAGQLKDLGVNVPQDPEVFDVACGISGFVQDYVSKNGVRSDISEIASSAAMEALLEICSPKSGKLFESSPNETKEAFRKLSSKTNFSKLGHEFFSRFTYRYVGYLLSRELSNHVGPNKKFDNIYENLEFHAALDLHCRQATKIVDEFSGGWYAKKKFEDALDKNNVANFLYVAIKKLRAEFKRGGVYNEGAASHPV